MKSRDLDYLDSKINSTTWKGDENIPIKKYIKIHKKRGAIK
tara:strand:+ start:1281 stop:1403 length:123 start_codon:yes stop_codon:yes gene_type:complete